MDGSNHSRAISTTFESYPISNPPRPDSLLEILKFTSSSSSTPNIKTYAPLTCTQTTGQKVQSHSEQEKQVLRKARPGASLILGAIELTSKNPIGAYLVTEIQ